MNINIPASVLASVEAALQPLFEDIAHNKELGSWFSVRLVGTTDPLKLELGIAWECNHKGARATQLLHLIHMYMLLSACNLTNTACIRVRITNCTITSMICRAGMCSDML